MSIACTTVPSTPCPDSATDPAPKRDDTMSSQAPSHSSSTAPGTHPGAQGGATIVESSPVGATTPTAGTTEAGRLQLLAADIEAWWATARFAHTSRPYSAHSVAALRSTLPITYPAATQATKLYKLLRSNYEAGVTSRTFGALDPVQVAQMAPFVDTVYVSGWQCAATASTTNEPGPDFADYPMNTVPNKVDQLFRAQLFQDRRQAEARARMTAAERAAVPATDYLNPMIADMDTGHGGIPAVMRLMKLMIEAGAAGVHIEDQKPGSKKCGHMGGKVLVSTREHVDRLIAARLQADVMGAGTVIVARTDADSARLLDNNIDPRDQPFIMGSTNPDLEALTSVIERTKADGGDVAAANAAWMESAGLCTFEDAVAAAIEASALSASDRAGVLARWRAAAPRLGNAAARKFAAELGFAGVHWDWDAPRTREGYYRINGCVEFCIARACAFGPHADLIWMETSSPNLEQATTFAAGVHAVHPELMLCYNLSPSFNWDAAGMSDAEIAAFPAALGRIGFCWQFITLAGFHVNSLGVTRLASALAGDASVFAYVRDVQRKERDEGVSTLTHQKWAGAALADRKAALITGKVSAEASMQDSTEDQFAATTPCGRAARSAGAGAGAGAGSVHLSRL